MTVVALTSCAKIQTVKRQPVWAEIAARVPDLLLLLGDNIYLKRDDHDDPALLRADLDARYAAQLAEPHFAELLASLARRGGRVLATFDDHDSIGDDRGGADIDPALVEAARAAFHRWLPCSTNAPEIYCRYERSDVCVLMLDARSYRSARGAETDADGLLGAAQWAWLEAQLASPRPTYTLVCSGSSLHDYGSESWHAWPAARRRLVALLRDRPGVLFLAGDVHDNELGEADGVIEVVSSAVARRGKLLRWKLANYGVLELLPDGVQVTLRGRQRKQSRDAWIPLAKWRLPAGASTARGG